MCLLERRRPAAEKKPLSTVRRRSLRTTMAPAGQIAFPALASVASVGQSGAWQGDAESIDESA